MARRRLRLDTPDGVVTLRDLSLPGARLVDVDLPDGRRVRVAEHLCGWACSEDPAAPAPLWRTVGEAVAAFTGRTGGGEDWIGVLEEYATRLGAGGEPLPPGAQERLDSLRKRVPTLYLDGPRAADGGGWYAFVGGLPKGAWVLEHADTPEQAAEAALARAQSLASAADE